MNFEATDSAFLTDLGIYVLALWDLGATFWPFEDFDLSPRTRLDELAQRAHAREDSMHSTTCRQAKDEASGQNLETVDLFRHKRRKNEGANGWW